MTQLSNLVLLDACCLLNLYATGRMRDIALALSFRLGVVDYVLEEEALYVWGSVGNEAREEPIPVDLSPLLKDGSIQVMRLEHQEEEENFVDLAALVDDGEAMTGALALHRGCGLATDDRKGRRILAERAPTVPLISTLELLKQWADQSSISQADLRSAMGAMRSAASYVPRDQDPLYEWWRAIMGEKFEKAHQCFHGVMNGYVMKLLLRCPLNSWESGTVPNVRSRNMDQSCGLTLCPITPVRPFLSLRRVLSNAHITR